jgi:hypothetical protein
MTEHPEISVLQIAVTVDGTKIVSVAPPIQTCRQACYLDWTFTGATAAPLPIIFNGDDQNEFVRQPSPAPMILRYKNRCTLRKTYTYSVQIEGGVNFDPSIDNVPK